MNEPNQVSDGRVYAGDQVWPNIFEAVGFRRRRPQGCSPLSTPRSMPGAVRPVCSWPRRGNQARSLGPVPGRARTRVVNDGCRVGKTTDPQRGSNQNPQRGAAPPAPGGSCAPRRFRALARPTPAPPLPCLPGGKVGVSLTGWGEWKRWRVRLSTGEAKRSRWAKAKPSTAGTVGRGSAPATPQGSFQRLLDHRRRARKKPL